MCFSQKTLPSVRQEIPQPPELPVLVERFHLDVQKAGPEKCWENRAPLGMVGSMPLSCLFNTLPVGVLFDIWG